jgi:hypothetical protein
MLMMADQGEQDILGQLLDDAPLDHPLYYVTAFEGIQGLPSTF